MNSATHVLFNNYECKEGSFIYYLLEEAVFEEPSFWEYYNSVVQITKTNIGRTKNEEFTIAIVLTHNRIMASFLWHLTEDDEYVIKNYPVNTIQLYVERLKFLIDGYLKGYVLDESIFSDELKNPNDISIT